VEKNGQALQYASADLKKNHDIVTAGVEQCGDALKYVSEDLKNDPDIVAAAITGEQDPCHNWTHRNYCGRQLKDLITGILLALKEHGVEDPSDHPDFADTATIVEYAQQWKKELCERIWLVTEQCPKPLPEVLKQHILSFSRALVQEEYQSACDLIRCAPVIAADLNLESPCTPGLLRSAKGLRELALGLQLSLS